MGNLNTPALLFGIILLVASIALFLFGRVKPELQRDSDSVYAIIGVVCSLILFASAFELSLGMSFQQLLLIGTLIALMWENIQARQPKTLAPRRSGGSFGDEGRRGGYRAEMDDYGRPEPPRDPREPRLDPRRIRGSEEEGRRGGYRADFDDYGRPSSDPRRLREAALDDEDGRRRPRRDEPRRDDISDRPVGGASRDENRPRRPALEDRESREQRRSSSDWGDEWGPEPARKPARTDAWTEPDRPSRPIDRPVDRPVDRPERSRGSLGAMADEGLPRRRRPAVDVPPERSPERPADRSSERPMADRPSSERTSSERPISDRTGALEGDDIAAEFSVRPRRDRGEDRSSEDKPLDELPRRRRPPIGRPEGRPADESANVPYVDFKPIKPAPDEADNSSNFDD